MDCFDCTVIGDIFLDIAVPGNTDPGSLSAGGTSYCNFIRPTFGGSGNVAVGVSTLGGKAAFIGKAGSDPFGRLYVKDLENHGVLSKVFFDERSPTGLILVFVKEKERSFLIFRGANDRLSVGEIGKASELIRRSSFIYFCGYSLLHNPQKDAVLKAVSLAKKNGVKVVFDPGAYNLVSSKREFYATILDLCDVISLNVDEAKAVTRKTSFKDMISEIGQKVPLAALKCGEKGSLICEDGKIIRTKGYNVKPIDPTGAGDAFTSALIYGLNHRLSLELTGELANWFAAQVTRKIGARAFPSKLVIERFLKKFPQVT